MELAASSGVATQDYTITVENCLNTGEIKGLGSSCYWAGGIIGHANDFVLINNCTNTAPVSAQYGAGGIAGALWGKNAASMTAAIRATSPLTAAWRAALWAHRVL